MNRQQIPGSIGEHDVFRTLNKLPIRYRGRKTGNTHACEGADVHPGVRLIWTRCGIDVPENGAYLPNPPHEDPITCPACRRAEGPDEVGEQGIAEGDDTITPPKEHHT